MFFTRFGQFWVDLDYRQEYFANVLKFLSDWIMTKTNKQNNSKFWVKKMHFGTMIFTRFRPFSDVLDCRREYLKNFLFTIFSDKR